MRRHVVPTFLDFDYRANLLAEVIEDHWDEQVKETHRLSHESLVSSLVNEFGIKEIERKVTDFIAIGPLHASIIAHHNILLRQVRNAFIGGQYYPALAGASALGERILNHLILDLRENFKVTPEYKSVYRKNSFQDWGLAISVLETWRVLVPQAVNALRDLARLRNRSLHFTAETSVRLRDDALLSINYLMIVVQHQFPAFGISPWFIDGIAGVCFVRQSYENDPFVRQYYLPLCPYVGPHFAWWIGEGGWLAFDYAIYSGEKPLTDDEFRDLYNTRDANNLAPSTLPPERGIVCHRLHAV